MVDCFLFAVRKQIIWIEGGAVGKEMNVSKGERAVPIEDELPLLIYYYNINLK